MALSSFDVIIKKRHVYIDKIKEAVKLDLATEKQIASQTLEEWERHFVFKQFIF